MKKILLILAAIAPIAASSQITIVQGDLPVANTLWVQANDSSFAGVIPAGGTNQSWNFATLNNDSQDTTIFVSAAGTPYAAQFPGSNLCVASAINGYQYFTSAATGLYVNGFVYPGSGISINLNPAQLFVPVPFTYGNTIYNTARFQIDTTLGGQTIRFIHLVGQTFDGDGYGSLMLPNGSYTSTLRIKETDLLTDSILISLGPLGWVNAPGSPTQSQNTAFSWVRNGSGALLLTIPGDSLGTQGTGGATYYIFSGPSAVEEHSPIAEKNIYPNPSSSFVTVDLSSLKGQAETLYVYDITGRQMDAMNIQNIDRNTFDVRKYENGRYIMRISGSNMKPVTGSFTVVH